MDQADNTHKEQLLAGIVEAIRRFDRFAVFSHEEPDGDAIGSQIAVTTALRELGKEVVSLRIDPLPPPLSFSTLTGPSVNTTRSGITISSKKPRSQSS